MSKALSSFTLHKTALPELRFVRVKNAAGKLEHDRLSYLEHGAREGEAVLLLHGIGSNAIAWRHVATRLAAQFRVVAWNAPGYYLSSDFRMEAPIHRDYAEILAELCDALDLSQVHVVGSSFGSMVAASFAVLGSERVRTLALLGPTRGHKHLPGEQRAELLARRANAIADGPLNFAATRYQQLVAPGATSDVIDEVRHVLAAVCPRGFMQAAKAVSQTDLVELAPGIRAPTIVAVGTEDVVNPVEVGRAIHVAIPRSRLELLEGVGHLSKLEAPERVFKMLKNHFLQA